MKRGENPLPVLVSTLNHSGWRECRQAASLHKGAGRNLKVMALLRQ
jgi:hypothetical protein